MPLKQMIKTAEFVSPRHPDKICDFIADSILDAFLAQDKESRVAVEVMGGHGHITVSGEITSHADVDMEKIIHELVGADCKIAIHFTKQSPQIAHGVDTGGAGDQGIMVGYACNETENFMPLEYELARNLCQEIYKVYPFDGKVQVTIEGSGVRGEGRVKTVVASFQNTKTPELLKLVQSKIQAEEYLINPAGEWTIGGFDADSGITGRKLIIDAYGPNVPVGGGSFSGKDYTKVDRSGAYMARKIAVDLLKTNNAREVLVKLAYAIGKPQPVMSTIILDSNIVPFPHSYDLTPGGIRKLLQLDKPIYAETASWGHFGRGFIWDK
jgi:S-adenosylmethionine synthetase